MIIQHIIFDSDDDTIQEDDQDGEQRWLVCTLSDTRTITSCQCGCVRSDPAGNRSGRDSK